MNRVGEKSAFQALIRGFLLRLGERCGRDSYLVLRLRIDYPGVPHHDHRQTLLGLALLGVLGNVGVGGRERLEDPYFSYIIALVFSKYSETDLVMN